MSELGKLYPDVLLEHHRAPRHTGRLPAPTHAADGHNPLCGDRVSVTLEIGEGRVLDVRCEVKGCAICRASGSMLAEAVIGRELSAVEALLRRFSRAIAAPATPTAAPGATEPGATEPGATEPGATEPGGLDGEAWGPLGALLEARRFPNRRRCASLGWEVLERALASPTSG